MTNKEELEKYSYSLFKKINSNYQSEKDYHLETLSRIFSEDFKKENIRKYASYLKDNKGYQEYFNKKLESDIFLENSLKNSAGLILTIFMAENMENMLKHKWPFSEKELNEIMMIVGK